MGILMASGWWYTYPSEKWWTSSVGIMKFSTEWKNHPFMFQSPPTSCPIWPLFPYSHVVPIISSELIRLSSRTNTSTYIQGAGKATFGIASCAAQAPAAREVLMGSIVCQEILEDGDGHDKKCVSKYQHNWTTVSLLKEKHNFLGLSISGDANIGTTRNSTNKKLRWVFWRWNKLIFTSNTGVEHDRTSHNQSHLWVCQNKWDELVTSLMRTRTGLGTWGVPSFEQTWTTNFRSWRTGRFKQLNRIQEKWGLK